MELLFIQTSMLHLSAAGAVSTLPTNIVMSYNNYFFNYTLPATVCTIALGDHVTVPAITIPIPILSFPNRASYSQTCQLLFNRFNEQTLTLTLTCALPFSLFQAEEWIPPHCKVEIDFNVNTNWRNEILSCVGAFPANGVVGLSSATNTVNSSIGVGIDDISLWLLC